MPPPEVSCVQCNVLPAVGNYVHGGRILSCCSQTCSESWCQRDDTERQAKILALFETQHKGLGKVMDSTIFIRRDWPQILAVIYKVSFVVHGIPHSDGKRTYSMMAKGIYDETAKSATFTFHSHNWCGTGRQNEFDAKEAIMKAFKLKFPSQYNSIFDTTGSKIKIDGGGWKDPKITFYFKATELNGTFIEPVFNREVYVRGTYARAAKKVEFQNQSYIRGKDAG